MKQFLGCILLLMITLGVRASHITGGEMYYVLQGVNNGIYSYRVNLKLFKRCNSAPQFNNPAIISIFTKAGVLVKNVTVPLNDQKNIKLNNTNKCITNPPDVCYDVAYYFFDVELPASAAGYIISYQVVYRIAGINNLQPGYGNIGATYTAEIPGTSTEPTGPTNNSARFNGNDLVVVCANNAFTYSFSAEDDDKDELRYSFAPAFQGGTPGAGNGSGGGGGTGSPSSPPPFESVPYGQSFPYSSPLGSKVKIDPKTGLIKGTAPAPGIYVVTVQVEEIRNGVVIAIQRKDLQIAITDCSIAAASIDPEYFLCRDTKTIELINVSNSPLINTYEWNIYNNAGQNILNSSSSSVLYTFQDTGLYSIHLIINKGQECSDSAVSIARVYPGFKPGFTVSGVCFPKPTSFKDATTSVYGTVNSWKWDFDEPGDSYGLSTLQNPTYTFLSQGTREVTLTVSNTVGCIDTISKFVSIVEKPPLDLAFKDTLICFNDSVQIIANTQGNYSWNPAGNIINANTAYPIVFPKKTTLYYGILNIDGCVNTDSVLIRVTDHVDLIQMPDTTICQGDPIVLRLNSNGAKYVWTPAATLNDPTLKQPTATTNATTKYHVIVSIGSCKASADINVKTAPYPIANAGKDTVICYNSFAQLKGIYQGSIFAWSPANSLSKSNIVNPIAHPFATTEYVFTVTETLGCPKPASDTILITVLPPIKTFAGNDTTVVTTQPLQLHGTGGENFTWSPGTYLSATNIADPIATFPTAFENIKLKLVSNNEAGCADSAYINIKVYNTLPKVFVPTAFTPNSDGKNDKLRPIAVGIKKIETFNIYNRWGELVYSSPDEAHGWDGTVKGLPQANGVFAWIVKAIDFSGKAYIQKGTVVLIR